MGVALLPKRCAVTELARGQLAAVKVQQVRLARQLRLVVRAAHEQTRPYQRGLRPWGAREEVQVASPQEVEVPSDVRLSVEGQDVPASLLSGVGLPCGLAAGLLLGTALCLPRTRRPPSGAAAPVAAATPPGQARRPGASCVEGVAYAVIRDLLVAGLLLLALAAAYLQS